MRCLEHGQRILLQRPSCQTAPVSPWAPELERPIAVAQQKLCFPAWASKPVMRREPRRVKGEGHRVLRWGSPNLYLFLGP